MAVHTPYGPRHRLHGYVKTNESIQSMSLTAIPPPSLQFEELAVPVACPPVQSGVAYTGSHRADANNPSHAILD